MSVDIIVVMRLPADTKSKTIKFWETSAARTFYCDFIV